MWVKEPPAPVKEGKEEDGDVTDTSTNDDFKGGAVIQPDDPGDEESTAPLMNNQVILDSITLSLEKGKLYGVVGSVGSGKSSLLSAILGDMSPTEGSKVKIPHKTPSTKAGYTGYCCQTPWVVNDTLKGNILFGRDWDAERYEKVLNCCALKADLAVLPAGDATEIGEKGINLSGGQKAR